MCSIIHNMRKKHDEKYKHIYIILRASGRKGLLYTRTRKEARDYVLSSKGRHRVTHIGCMNELLSTIGRIRKHGRYIPIIGNKDFTSTSYSEHTFIMSPCILRSMITCYNYNNVIRKIPSVKLIDINKFFNIKKD